LPILGNVSFDLEEYAMSEMRELTTTELDAVSGGWGFNIGSFNGNFNDGSGNGNGNAGFGNLTLVTTQNNTSGSR
jgi:hypothetical protein